MFEMKNLATIVGLLRESKFNTNTGEKLIGYKEMDNFLGALFSDKTIF
jgi:hypothetical protein